MCDYNKKFLYYVLKSSDVLDVLVPILYHLNDSRADQCEYRLQINKEIFKITELRILRVRNSFSDSARIVEFLLDDSCRVK